MEPVQRQVTPSHAEVQLDSEKSPCALSLSSPAHVAF